MPRAPVWFGLLIMQASFVLYGQDADAFKSKPDSLPALTDTLSMFRLIDSLMMLFEEEEQSAFQIRLTYNSNVMAAGRTLGIDQFGLSPGVTWYHKSGFYADATLYWSADFEPKYYLTVLSAGFTQSITTHFMASASYDRYEYRFDDSYVPFRNAITLSGAYDFTYLLLQADYTFFFGDEQVHRITPSVTGQFSKKNFLTMDRIRFTPGLYLLFGDAVFTEIILPQTAAEWAIALWRMRNGLPWYTVKTHREFGLMNYAFTAPLYFEKGNFSFMVSYMHNVPRPLPSETLDLSESSFIMAGLSYRLPVKRKSDW